MEKNKGGRPPKWKSVEDLELAINSWYKFLDENTEEIPDVESFCHHAGTNRCTLLDYEKKVGFSESVKDLKNFIAYKKKQLGLKGKIPPAIFCFDFKNNHNYEDSKKIDADVKSRSYVSFLDELNEEEENEV